MRSSQAAFDLIVKEEVSSQQTYTRKYRRPEWPGASSGPTIGIGYDLGQTPASTIKADWGGRVPDDMLDAMLSCSGKTGETGRAWTKKVHHLIDIPWDLALAVHMECVIPRWEARLIKALPNTHKLHPDSFGALHSLTFNRGLSFNNSGSRYAEMRAIKAHMARENFDLIPDEFRKMKRLWPNLVGLQKRREREALLFERGLRSAPQPLPPPPDIEPIPKEGTDVPNSGRSSFLKRWWKWITGSGVLGTLTIGGVTFSADIIYAIGGLLVIAFVVFLGWVYLVPPRGQIRKGLT